MNNLVSCGKSVLVHDHAEEPLLSITPHRSNVNCVIWNHNNFVIASCGNDGVVSLSHAQKGNNLLTLEDNGKPLNSIHFSSNSQYLASGGQDSIVRIWDLKKKGIIAHLKGHYSQVNSVHWNTLDSLVASASNVGDIILHDVASQINVGNFTLSGSKTPGFKVLKFMPLHRNYLASGANDGSVTVWDVISRESTANFTCQHNSKVNAISCSPLHPNMLCSVGTDQKVNFYNINEKKCVSSIYCENPLASVSYSNDGCGIAVGTLYGQIHIYDIRNSQKPKMTLKGHENSSVNYMEYMRISEEERSTRSSNLQKSTISGLGLKESNISQKSQAESVSSQKSIVSEQMSKLPSKSVLDDIKRESIQRIEQTRLVDQSQLKGLKLTDQKTNITQRSQFEQSSIKIEDISRKYDKMQEYNGNGGGFNEEQKKYLQGLMNEQLYQIKQYMSEQMTSVHIDMIRQFQIQENQLHQLMEHYMVQQNQLVSRVSQLENENSQLRHQTY